MKTLRSRFLMELTTPEVEAYFKRGGKTAFLPVGSVEMHGPHLPIGTDTIIARAFSLLMARETDGIVLPEVSYSWAGATDGFAGTINIPPQMVIELVTRVAIHSWKMGFRRFVVISIHWPNEWMLNISVGRLYETHGVVAQYLRPFTAASPEAEKLFAGPWRAGKEASLALGALTILGQEKLYSEKETAFDAADSRTLISEMGFKGSTGSYYQELIHHVRPSRYTSRARAVEFFDLQVKALAPSVKKLDVYARKARKQKNQGWSRVSPG